MDAIRQQLLRIQQQLAGLSASQKMLTATLVIIMVMTMFYWARYAGTAEMAALLDQSLTAEEISSIKSSLASKNVKYEVTGDRIMVPADRKFELIADLGYAQLLPRDMKDAFEEIVMANDNPFHSRDQSEQIYNHAREKKLATIMSVWPGVRSATVMIDGTNKRNPTRSIQPTASVAISMKSGEQGSKKLADAVAQLVAGAQAGLSTDSVKVMINGIAIKQASAGNPWDAGENPVLKAKVEAEAQYAAKILGVLAYIPNAYATVSVELNSKTTTINEKNVDKGNKVEAVKRTMTTSEENTAAVAAGEPGAASNTGVSIAGSNADGGQNSVSEKNETEFNTEIGFKQTQTSAPAGDAIPVAAAVRVPDSYFISMWKRRNANSTSEPSETDLDTLVKAQMPQIVDAVRMATNIKDAAAISVARYVDVSEPIGGMNTVGAGLTSLPSGFGFGAKEIAIGVLAVVSLFMVSMMVRKSVPQPVIQTAMATGEVVKGGPNAITAMAELVGEVGEGGALMSGHEMSDSDMEAKQVIDQVGTMVKENPEAAANLIKRWLNRD